MAEFLSEAALAQTEVPTVYDGSYVRLAYPGGDVAADHGVCTDVVIRAYRKAGVDLQVKVHEDRLRHRDKTDQNIDHRRVPNLMTFFSRMGASLPATRRAEDYLPGDVVAWDLGHGLKHVGLVADRKKGGRFLVVHNIGEGPKLEDVLFDWKVIGHYRYAPGVTER